MPVRRLTALALFALAFGYVEAAVVVYLRALGGAAGGDFPVAPLPDRLVAIEVAREAATIVMLLAVAALAGRGRWARFGAFAAAFGIWDLAYYAGLRFLAGWPASWLTWDVLFLIPAPWSGPVLSAAILAALLALGGGWLFVRAEEGLRPRPGARTIVLALASLALLLASFLWNHRAVENDAAPAHFPWIVWVLGVAAGLASLADLVLGDRSVRLRE